MSPGVVVVLLATVLNAATLPPGAVLRLGDDRWRAGGRVDQLVFSPDGKLFATCQGSGSLRSGVVTLKVWDAGSGRPAREAQLNQDLFCGFAWGNNGGFAVVRRVDRDAKGRGTLVPDDFQVWAFSDPYAFPPPLFDRIQPRLGDPLQADVARPKARTELTDFALSADGSRVVGLRIAAGKHVATAEVYELAATSSATLLCRVASPPDVIVSEGVLLTPDGHGLIVYSTNGVGNAVWASLTPWDLGTGKVRPTIRIDCGSWETAISSEGRTMAVAIPGPKAGIALIDLTTGKMRAELPYPKAPFRDRRIYPALLAFSPDGKQLLMAIERGALVIDVATGKERGRLGGHAAEISAVAFSPDGRRIATADDVGLIRLWDAATLRPLNEPKGHRAPVWFAQLSPGNKRLLTWSRDETVRVWDLATGKELRAFDCVRAPTFTPDGLALLVAVGGRTICRDILTGAQASLPGKLKELPLAQCVFSPDGQALFVRTDEDGSLWNWPDGTKRAAVAFHGPVPPSEFSADGKLLCSERSSVLWDTATGQFLGGSDDWEKCFADFVSLTPNGCRGFYDPASPGGPLRILDGASGRPVPGAMIFTGSCDTGLDTLALSPGGSIIAASRWGNDRELCLFETATLSRRQTVAMFPQPFRVLGFMPDGTRLLTVGADHTVLVWDVRLQAVPLPPEVRRETNAARLWATMTAGKADAAYLAMARLAAEPAAAVATARKRMKPATPPSAATLEQLLRELGDDEFAVREAAEKELDGYGEPAAELVKARIIKLESAEARRRADDFVKRWSGDGATGTRLSDSRAVELLEALGTPEAKAFLKELADGEASAWRTKEAKRAVSGVGGRESGVRK